MAVGFIHGTVMTKLLAGESVEAHRLAEWAIDLLDGDPGKGMTKGGRFTAGNYRGLGRKSRGSCLGRTSWRDDMRRGIALERSVNPDGLMLSFLISVGYTLAMHVEAVGSDDHVVEESAEAVRLAEESGDDVALGTAYIAPRFWC